MKHNHPHRAGRYDWITFLVTGPEDKLMAWQTEAAYCVDLFYRRGQTVRCRAHGRDRGQIAYGHALLLATHYDVTMQDLGSGASVTVADCVEEYPVVHLGSHGMKWPAE